MNKIQLMPLGQPPVEQWLGTWNKLTLDNHPAVDEKVLLYHPLAFSVCIGRMVDITYPDVNAQNTIPDIIFENDAWPDRYLDFTHWMPLPDPPKE